MRMIDLALKDLSQMLRDWRSAVFLVAMPIAFTLLFAFVFGGSSGEEDARLPVGFLDQDGGGVLSTHLLALLEGSDAIRPVVPEDGDLEGVRKEVQDGDLAAAVIVPAGYSAQALALAGDAPPQLIVVVDTASSAGQTAQTGIQGATTRLLGAVQAARLSAQALEAQGGTADEAFFQAALAQAIEAWTEPSLSVKTSQSGAAIAQAEEEGSFETSGYAHSSTGIMVQFAIAGIIGAATILVLERKSGALRRLLTTAISRIEIILGHYLAMFAIIFGQLTILVVFGQLALDVEYTREPLATLLMMVVTALWAASLGLLIGTFSKTDDQVAMFSIVTMMVLSAMGGAWFPLEFSGQAFQTIGHLTPAAWAIDGFENIVVRRLGFNSVLLPAAILLAYAAAFFGIAVWRFKFE
jgi:ABC-2 type transport system permease protein